MEIGNRIRTRLNDRMVEKAVKKADRERDLMCARKKRYREREKHKMEPDIQKLMSLRMPVRMLDEVKSRAAQFGTPYQVMFKLLVEQGLLHIQQHGSLEVRAYTPEEERVWRLQQRALQGLEPRPPSPKKSTRKKAAVSVNGMRIPLPEDDSPVATPHDPISEQKTVATPPAPKAKPKKKEAVATVDTEAVATASLESIAGVATAPPSQEALQEELTKEPPHTSKASLLRAMLEEEQVPVSEPSMEGLVEALTTSSIPPSESGEELRIASEYTNGVHAPPLVLNHVASDVMSFFKEEQTTPVIDEPVDTPLEPLHDEEGVATALSAKNDELPSEPTLEEAVATPSEPQHDEPVATEPTTLFFDVATVLSSETPSEPVDTELKIESPTAQEIEAMLSGDSEVSAEASAEDLMEQVLNQFHSSEAQPGVATARASDEEERPPHVNSDLSEDDFAELLSSL